MSAARLVFLLTAFAALAACRNDGADQNVVITNDVPADAEIETLPPDESVVTPTDELQNGAADPNVNEAVVDGG